MARKAKQPFVDDGRTVVSMDVDGLRGGRGSDRPREFSQAQNQLLQERMARTEPLNTRLTFRYTVYAILAGLAVVGFVGGGTVLFIFILWLLMK